MSKQTPVVVFLVDGLRHRDYPTRQRIMPNAGFRHAEASLFTGEPAARHGIWTDYGYSTTTPFRAVCRAPGLSRLWMLLPRAHRRYLNFLIHRVSEMLSKNSLPRSSLIPPRLLAHALPTQRVAPDSDEAYPGFDSIFTTLRAQRRRWLYLGPPHISYFGARDALVEKRLYAALRRRRYDFYYIKLGDLDSVSHAFGPDSAEARGCRTATLRRIENMRSEIHHAHGNVRWVLLSDHGFVTVKGAIPTPPWLEESFAARRLLYYFVDSTILRLWLPDPADGDDVRQRMAAVEQVEPLDDRTRKALGLEWGSSQVGHLAFLCRTGMVFWPDFFSVHPPKGMHGYLPTDDLACPVETHGMPTVEGAMDHALLGRLLRQVIGDE